MSSAANSQLLSAALVSARHSAARAGAHLPRVATARLGGGSSLEAQGEDDLPLSSRERRRSRAARFGSISSESATAMPDRLVDATRQWAKDAPKPIQSHGKALRSAHPHLLSSDAALRYAVLSRVLAHVADRMGDLGPASHDDTQHAGWAPDHVDDVNCAAGEGLWAAHAAWPSLQSYAGIDASPPLVRAAVDMLALARSDASASSTPTNVKASFRTTRSLSAPGFSAGQDAAEQIDASRTLFLAPYALSKCSTDGARTRLVQDAWNKGAQVLVFIEEGDERGFACIASAREELLSLGRGSIADDGRESIVVDGKTYFAELREGEEVQESAGETGEGSFVVAPCPHDSPCPLLHDFVPLPMTHPGASKATKGPFHGAPSLPICAFPIKATLPTHARAIGEKKRRDEATRYSYVAVARGHRPSKAVQGQGRAENTKAGILDALRAGPKRLEPNVIELGDDSVQQIGSDLASSSLGGGEDDSFAKAQLAALLPEILAREAKRSGADSDSLQDAIAQAQAIWSDSVTIAEDAIEAAETREASEAEEAAAEALELSANFVAASTEAAESGEVAQLLARADTFEDQFAIPSTDDLREEFSDADEAAMRREALTWPRLVRPPLKKGGHVTFDACMASGAIERYTLAKSAGRQPYHDARKATWGDAFPHLPTKATSPRVAAAGEERSTAPRKPTSSPHKQIKKELMSSASAIGADVVAPQEKQRKEGTDRQTGRRGHYEPAAGRREGIRSNRKRSINDYQKEVADAWDEEDAEYQQ